MWVDYMKKQKKPGIKKYMSCDPIYRKKQKSTSTISYQAANTLPGRLINGLYTPELDLPQIRRKSTANSLATDSSVNLQLPTYAADFRLSASIIT